MTTPTNEAAELAERASNLRAAIARAKMDLRTASEEERALSERIAELAQRDRDAERAAEAPVRAKRVEEPTVLIPQKKKQIQRAAFGMGLGAAAATMLLVGGLVWLAFPFEEIPPAPRTPRQLAADTVRPGEPPGRAMAPRRALAENPYEARRSRTDARTDPRADLLSASLGDGKDLAPVRPMRDERAIDAEQRRALEDLRAAQLALGHAPSTRADIPTDRAEKGALTIVCLPKCTSIVDNGISLGPGHIFSRPSTPGRHTLVLTDAFADTKTVTVDVVPGQLRDVRIAMGGATPPATTPDPMSDRF